MKPKRFPAVNLVMGEGQPEYVQLPAHKGRGGCVTSMWRPSLLERVRILFGAPLWLQVHTFNRPMQPVKLSLDIEWAHDRPTDPCR